MTAVLAKARSRVSPVAIRRALYADRWVPRYRAALQHELNRQVRQIAAEAYALTPDTARHVTEWSEKLDRVKKRWVYPIVITGYELAGKEVARIEEAGKSSGDVLGKADVPTPPPISPGRQEGGEFLLRGDFESIDKWVATTSVGESQTSASKLEKIWKDAVASRDPETGAAWTPDQISKQILRRGLVGNRHRADMLAKTGAIWSVNEGAQQRYRAAGVKAERWLTTKDDALCPYCAGMNDKVVSIDEPFWPAGSEYGNPAQIDQSLKLPYEVQHPPLHPRCRCSLIPVMLPGEVTTPTPEIKLPARGVARPTIERAVVRKPLEKPVIRSVETPENIKTWANALSKDEKRAVFNWTESASDIRDYQSGLGGSDEIRKMSEHLTSAMRKSPRHTGEVWRGITNLDDETFNRFLKAKKIRMKAAASTSPSHKVAEEFATAEGYIGDNNVLLQFRKQRSGTNIEPFQVAGEEEVILPKGARFLVKGRKYERIGTNTVLRIILEEIP